MADVVLFHSAYGLRPAVRADADRLRGAGHQVTTPDLYDGAIFDDLDAGMAQKDRLGAAELGRRAEAAVRALPPADGRFFLGWSMGAEFALNLARKQPGTAGLLVVSSELWYDDDQPDPFPAQIHAATGDEWVDDDAVSEAKRRGAQVFRYSGGHIFTDPELPGYDAESARLLKERIITFLSGSPADPGNASLR